MAGIVCVSLSLARSSLYFLRAVTCDMYCVWCALQMLLDTEVQPTSAGFASRGLRFWSLVCLQSYGGVCVSFLPRSSLTLRAVCMCDMCVFGVHVKYCMTLKSNRRPRLYLSRSEVWSLAGCVVCVSLSSLFSLLSMYV
jgi:hypothetical protein